MKIGRAGNPKQRLAALATAHPWGLELRHVIKTSHTRADVILEREIHEYLRERRVQGEWFEMTPEVLTETINYFDRGDRYADR